MSLFLTEPLAIFKLGMKPCISKLPSQETDSEPQRAKYLKIFIFTSPIHLEEAKDPRCGIANV
jgi:hypothetical protein